MSGWLYGQMSAWSDGLMAVWVGGKSGRIDC